MRRRLLTAPRALTAFPRGAFSRGASTRAQLYYQSDRVPRSLTSTGTVGTDRDSLGSDGEFFGVDPIATETPIADGRGRPFSLDANGFCRVDHALDHIDYYDNQQTLDTYYSQCEALVAEATGATRVLAFDHNLRARTRKEAAARLKGDGANAVQARAARHELGCPKWRAWGV